MQQGGLTFQADVAKAEKRIESLDEVLGKGYMMPFNAANSASRKIMQSTQTEHVLALYDPEVPLVATGMENRFGETSSYIMEAKADYEVIKKIPKFSHLPDHIYTLFINTVGTNEYDIIKRTPYEHITESYGILFNNDYIDSKSTPGSYINKGSTVLKTRSYDVYNNRMDGVNLITTYNASEYTKEDGIRISETAARKLSSPLIKRLSTIINENDIPLNLYGDDNIHKAIPDINESIKDGILIAIRREKKEEALYSLARSRLKVPMISDEKLLSRGEVVDIDIYCNNPVSLESSPYGEQLKYYYDEYIRYISEFVKTVDQIKESGGVISNAIEICYVDYKNILNGGLFIKDRPFNNIYIDVYVIEKSAARIGDKISNRYGGKGCISCIVPDNMMYRLSTGEYVEVEFNSSTCVNRENLGQLLELSLNNVSSQLCTYINMNILELEECKDIYLRFLAIVCPSMYNEQSRLLASITEDELAYFLYSVTKDKGFMLSMLPMTESINLDDIDRLYKEFPFVGQYEVYCPQVSSTGEIRYVKARRKLTCGREYIYRLKQYAEEKFSAVSLTAINIRSEPTRNIAKKGYKTAHGKTPIRFGNMESESFGHLGMELVVQNLMIHSASPHGRRLAENLYTGDPFRPNITLDEKSTNRTAEVNATYFLPMGVELAFIKRKKLAMPHAMFKKPFYRVPQLKLLEKPFYRIDPNEVYDEKIMEELRENSLDKRIMVKLPYLRKL